ncbi:MAG: hypothetical protein ACRBK7_24745, partial [Acidimicrobiales bacterium]
LPSGLWAGPRDDAWKRLTDTLGIAAAPAVGDTVETSGAGVPTLSGTVVDATAHRLTILVDQPAPGTAFLAAEGGGDQVEVSIWTYLYGPEGAAAGERDQPRWQQLLAPDE